MAGSTPRRRALLLGCGTFADNSLAPLRSPQRDVEELTKVLRDNSTTNYQVVSEIDCTSRRAQRAVEAFLLEASRTDSMNLIYLSCHGVQNSQGELYFAFSDTEKAYLSSTAVSASWVRDRINDSRSKATVVLVDCCFSGAFIKGMQARSGAEANVGALVRDLAKGSGVAVLAASGTMEVSFEDAESEEIRPSYFTQALISGIGTGAADINRDGLITADELYDNVFDHVVNGPSPQRPQGYGMGEGTLVVADAPVLTPVVGASPSRRVDTPILRARAFLGYLSFDGQWVVVGQDGFGQQFKGEHRYHVSQLSGTALKPASRLIRGYFQVLQKGITPAPVNRWGSNPGTPDVEVGDAVIFGKGANQDITRIRDAIEDAIAVAEGKPHPTPSRHEMSSHLTDSLVPEVTDRPQTPTPETAEPSVTYPSADPRGNATTPPSSPTFAGMYPPYWNQYGGPPQPMYSSPMTAPMQHSSRFRKIWPWVGRVMLWPTALGAVLFEVAAFSLTVTGAYGIGEAVGANLVFLIAAVGLVWLACWDLRRLTRSRGKRTDVPRR